ncbi:MAG: PqiC family protein [Gammaproteobacteria bacterium]|nr:PqiC family protein [Gammaproteobacteria bacterium]
MTSRWPHLLLVLLLVSLASSCAVLPGSKPKSRSSVYLLETQIASLSTGDQTGCRVIIVNPPDSAPGQNGAQMLYQRHANQIERFAFSRWAASPAVMFEPLLLDALRASGSYRAVLPSPAPVRGDLRIANDGLWLIQRFEGDRSEIELRMSSQLYAPAQRQVVATRDFNYVESAGDATPAAGVAAAERALERLLGDFSQFVADAVSRLESDCVAEN